MKIELNKELDKEMYLAFKGSIFGGVNFGEKIAKDHLEISEENYVGYIDQYYLDNKTTLENARLELQNVILEKQDKFFKALKDLFQIDFTNTNYTGYISIFNCNPRFIESNSFQIYCKKSLIDKVEVVFHEIMHFAFFEYCKRNLADKTKDLDTNSGPLWELSEIFNVIILNEPVFKNILGREETLFYPSLSQKLEKIREFWNNKKALKGFTKVSLNYLSN